MRGEVGCESLEEVEGAGDVGCDEGGLGVGADVRLVEGCGVDDGGDVWVRVEDALDGVGGCDVHEKGGGGRGEDVDSDGGEAEGGEGQHEGTAEVARGAGDENEGGLFVGHCR